MAKDILEEIKEGRTVSLDVVKAAQAEIVSKQETALKEEMIQALLDARYAVALRKLKLRRARALAKTEEDSIDRDGATQVKLEAGGMTPEEFRKELATTKKECTDAARKVKEEYFEYLQQLNSNFEGVSWGTRESGF